MHIHLPKALHGWREVLKEVGIIVLGVLIALSAEQVVQALHERQASTDARNSVRSEIAANLRKLMGRVDIQPCIDRRLHEIGSLLAQAREGVPNPHPSWISRPTFWSLPSSNWQAATAAGRAALLSHDDQIHFGSYFAGFDFLVREQEREQIAWAHLRGLEEWTGPLGPTARFGFAQALQDARYSNYRVRTVITEMRDEARQDRIAIPAGTLDHTRAICLPITTQREQAERSHTSPFGDPE
jgi:hypothetical protein